MPTKRYLARQLADAQQRNRELVDQREEALGDAGSEHFNTTRLAKQLNEARDEADDLRRELAARPPAPSNVRSDQARLRQRFALSERARRQLVDQIEELRRCNDDLSRQAVDRAGNLAVPEVTG